VERELLKFGGGVSHTIINPFVAIAILIAGILLCTLPRHKAIAPFLAASILIPFDQVLLIGPFHFMMLRVVILFGMWRLLTSKDKVFSGGMNNIDRAVILLTVFTAITWVLLWQKWAALNFQLGEIYTVFGVYFVLRFLIRDRDDVELTIRTFAYIAAVIGVIMAYEQATGWNPYALLGGAQASFFEAAMRREDRFRATGCFLHPILAGTFGAVLLPVFFGLWRTAKQHRGIAIMGMIASTIMTVASNSSTPVLGFAAGIFAICMWPLRNWMRPIRWAISLTLISLHMVMNAPVWQLITRVDIVGGSSSEHRYQLINQFIRHFWDWWLVGVKENGQWGWLMWDTANQYVVIGQNSGLLPFTLFLSVIVCGFKYVGKARRKADASTIHPLLVWSFGASLFAHVVVFFGISYFDQTIVAWYTLLALISAVFAVTRTTGLRQSTEREPSHPAFTYAARFNADEEHGVTHGGWT
jgi:hypothetical protein